MELTNISKSILLREAEEVSRVIHIINNSQTLNENQSQIYVAILPFISSICDGVLERLKTEGYSLENPEIEGIEFTKMVKNSRVAYKLYVNEKKNKIIRENDKYSKAWYSKLTEGLGKFGKVVVSILGQKDIGIYYYKEIPYGNTNQLGSYYLNLVKNKKNGKYIYFKKARFLSKYVEYIVVYIRIFLGNKFNILNTGENIKKFNIGFTEKDYYFIDKKRRNILTGILPDYLQMLLFNVYCQNNTVEIIIKKIFNSSGIFYTRSLIQTYIVSVQVLQRVVVELKNTDANLINEISKIVEYKEKIFKDSQFRNNIFHYNLEGVPLEVFNNEERYFYEMIEAYSGKNINDFINDIRQENNKINNIILKLVNFKLN